MQMPSGIDAMTSSASRAVALSATRRTRWRKGMLNLIYINSAAQLPSLSNPRIVITLKNVQIAYIIKLLFSRWRIASKS